VNLTGELAELLAEVTGHPELAALPPAAPLFGGAAGLDSLSGARLLRQVHERYGVDVAAEDLNLDALQSLGALAAFIADRR
jgi:acyl carrier protein